MMNQIQKTRLLVIVCLLTLFACENSSIKTESTILPKPQSVSLTNQFLDLSRGIKVVVPDELETLEQIIQDDYHLLVGRKSKQDEGKVTINLQINSKLQKEQYTLAIEDQVVIEGGSYEAVIQGLSSLWQLMDEAQQIPKGKIQDEPRYGYRSIMLDLARAWHDVETIKEIISLCRWYKINYLHLHLTDDSAFTFPSDAFPDLATAEHSYTKSELTTLNEYAKDRGVILIPEIDVPGHSSKFIKEMPELFGIKKVDNNPYTISMGKDEVYEALGVLMKEVAAVFTYSPYIHIGGDEAFFEGMEDDPETIAYMAKHQLPSLEELFRHFLIRMNDLVKEAGKQTIVWAGFSEKGKLEIPKDVIVLLWESIYYNPEALVKNGYSFINASFKPLYVVNNRKWSPEYIYKKWTPMRWESWALPEGEFIGTEIPETDLLMGATMCAWEQSQVNQLPRLRNRVASMSEHLWNPTANWTDFEKRQLKADAKLSRLLRPFDVSISGLTYPELGEGNFYEHLWFNNVLTISTKTAFDGLELKYSTAKNPSKEDWKTIEDTIELTETCYLRIQAFDAKEEKIGHTYFQRFFLKPISIVTKGLEKDLPIGSWAKHYFKDSLQVKLLTEKANCQIRYETDGKNPTNRSPLYTVPFLIDKTSYVRARLFDKNGEAVGSAASANYYEMWLSESLTTGKKTWSSNEAIAPGLSKRATNGRIALWEQWGDHKGEENWVQVDLEAVESVSKFKVVTFWDNYRYYQYTIEGSLDGKNWRTLVDQSKNEELSTAAGAEHEIMATDVRFLKVNLLFNSANPGLHLVEFGAY